VGLHHGHNPASIPVMQLLLVLLGVIIVCRFIVFLVKP
jgi:hypothetical protein